MEKNDKQTTASTAAEINGEEKWLRKEGVAELLGISRHTLARIIKRDSTFPLFVELSPGIHMIRTSKVMEWRRRKEFESYERAPAAHDATQ